MTEAYAYDPTDQLTNVNYGTGRTTAFNYDPTGNRTTVTDTTGLVPASYTANNLNQYTQVDATAPTYDANGNLTAYNGWTYTYDAQNRLTNAANSSQNSTVSIAYDGRNRQGQPHDGSQQSTLNAHFVWDGWSLIEEHDAAGAEQRRYIHGPIIDEILAMTDATATHYYHHDALSSTVALTDSNGEVVERDRYSVYGAPTIFPANGAQLTVSAFSNRFMFTGREWIAAASLYDYRSRYYSAENGRFLQTDGLRFDALDPNLYRYVGNTAVAGSIPTPACAMCSRGCPPA